MSNQEELERMFDEMMDEEATDTEISDDRQMHILDNGATTQIADERPVYADEMANSTTSINLDGHGLGGDGSETPMSGDEAVLGDALTRLPGELGDENVRGGYDERGPFRDDFVDMLHRQAKAATGPNGEHLDEFDQKFQEASDAAAALADPAAGGAAFARINPPSLTQGIIGGNATLTLGQSQIVAQWMGEMLDCSPITVTVGALLNALGSGGKGSGSTHPIRPYAIVQYGSRDANVIVEVDVGRGTQFTVGASFVLLTLAVEDLVPAVVPTAKDKITLAGMLSPWPCVRSTPVTRTKYYDLGLPPSSNVTFTIPARATNLRVLREIGAALAISFEDSANGFTSEVDIPASLAIADTGNIIIPGDAFFVNVENKDMVLTEYFRLVFELAL